MSDLLEASKNEKQPLAVRMPSSPVLKGQGCLNFKKLAKIYTERNIRRESKTVVVIVVVMN